MVDTFLASSIKYIRYIVPGGAEERVHEYQGRHRSPFSCSISRPKAPKTLQLSPANPVTLPPFRMMRDNSVYQYKQLLLLEQLCLDPVHGGLSIFDESFPNEDATSALRSLQEGSTKPPWGWVKPSRRLHPSPRRLRGAFLKASQGARGVFIWKRFVK